MDTNLLVTGFGISEQEAEKWLPAFLETFKKYDISTPERQAGFLGQVAVESGCLKWTRELWGPTAQQKKYERNFNAAWPPTDQDETNRVAYSLGNAIAGDGFAFRGGGLIQTTGRTNYAALTMHLEHDFLSNPQDIALPEWCVLSAGFYWDTHSLNTFADQKLWKTITLRVNGGLTAYDERLQYTVKFLTLLENVNGSSSISVNTNT